MFPDLITPRFYTAVAQVSGKWLHAFVISVLEVLGVFEAFEPSPWKMTWRYGPRQCHAQIQSFCRDARWKPVPSFEGLRVFLFSPVSQLLHECKTSLVEVCNYTLLGSAFGKFQRRGKATSQAQGQTSSEYRTWIFLKEALGREFVTEMLQM